MVKKIFAVVGSALLFLLIIGASSAADIDINMIFYQKVKFKRLLIMYTVRVMIQKIKKLLMK